MTMAPPPPPPAPAAAGLMAMNAKRYTLAALLATLLAAGIITACFAVLCPAHITFSVAHTGSHHRSSGAGAGSLELSLTLAAANPSRRAAVAYRSMFVDVSNGTAPGAQWDNWVRATVTTPMPLRQRGPSVSAVDATVPLVDAPWMLQAFTANMTNSFSVMVTAQARFEVGVVWTRLYDIKVSCSPVRFFPTTTRAQPGGSSGGGGGGGGGGTAGLPVPCV